jgi:uncharacterized protein YjbI with pentapeptide repeats
MGVRVSEQRSIRRLIVAAGAVVLVLGTLGVTFARADSPGQTYTGCLKLGLVFNVKIGTSPLFTCPPGSVQISWNQTGSAGANGVNGTNGADGESAYEIWLDLGNSGTERDFIDSLRGADGTDGNLALAGQNCPPGQFVAGFDESGLVCGTPSSGGGGPEVGADCVPLNLVPGADLHNCDLSGANLNNADLAHANMAEAILDHANLSGANLTLADLSNATAVFADLSGANMSGINLSNADLNNANLAASDLSPVDNQDGSWTPAILEGATLSFADMSNVNLLAAYSPNATLLGTQLSGANLLGATLNDANLSFAILNQANLSGANLVRADMLGADASNATLHGADMRDANVTLIVWANTTCPDGTNSDDAPDATCLDHLQQHG